MVEIYLTCRECGKSKGFNSLEQVEKKEVDYPAPGSGLGCSLLP